MAAGLRVRLTVVFGLAARALSSFFAARGRADFFASPSGLSLAAVLRPAGLGAGFLALFGAAGSSGAANVAEIFLAKHTFHAGDLGFGLLYSAMGAGLVLGSLVSAGMLARFGVARTYGGSLGLMAAGYVGAALSPISAATLPELTGTGQAIAAYVALMALISLVAVLLIPESRDNDLMAE